jgi:osmotically-inducible protein OsmY
MRRRKDDDILGGLAAASSPLSAIWLGGIFGEDRQEGSRDLGPAPIGSDPWLLAQVQAALARDRAIDRANVVVDVREAVVTIRGVAPDAVPRVESAARTVQGIKSLHVAR